MKAGAVISDEDDTRELIGEPKGIKHLLMELGLYPQNGIVGNCGRRLKDHTNDCCATALLMSVPSFHVTEPRLNEIITKRGHLCVFLPKVCRCLSVPALVADWLWILLSFTASWPRSSVAGLS